MADTDLQPVDPVPYPGTMASFVPIPPKGEKKSMDDMAGTVDYDAIRKSDTELTQKKIGADAANDAAQKRRDDQYRSRMDRMISAEGATMDDVKPWDAQKELSEYKTDLWSQFGSPGFVISMIASAFTAQPMLSALNSGAEAMNAINQGDMKAYDKAFDSWKENTNLTLKRIDLEQKQFDQIDKLRSSDMAAWRAQAAAIATRFNDQKMLALLNAGYDPQAIEVQENLAKLRGQLSDSALHIQDNDIRLKLFTALNGDNKDPQKMAQAAMDAETAMTNPTTPEQMVLHNLIMQPGFRDLPADEQNKKITSAVSSVYASRYGNRNPADAEKFKNEANIKTDLQTILGHDLSPELDADISAAYSAKGVNAAKITAAVNRAIASIRDDIEAGKSEKEINPEKRINDAIASSSIGVARSGPALFGQKLQQEHPEWGAEKIQKAMALYTKVMSSARALGTREANVDTAVVEAKKLADRAIAASQKVPRGDIVPFNSMEQVATRSTSNPDQAEFDTYNAGLITAYAQTMTRTGQSTVAGMNRAMDILKTATGPKAYERQARVLIDEMEIVQSAVKDVAADTLGGDDEGGKVIHWKRNPDTGNLEPAQ